MKVRDVMTASVVSVRPEAAVGEIARVLRDNRISAAPVLDQEGRLLGIVSEGDLLRRAEIGTERSASWWLRLFDDTSGLAAEYARTHGLTARDVMTAPAIHVDEDAELAEVAALLETHRIKRVPVVREGRVVGIVSRANLVQALASARPAMAAPSETDAAIRERLIAELQEQPWAALHEMNIVVQDGTVHLWGFVRSETERSAVRIAAERTAGVRAIEDHLLIKPLVMWE